jgi:hypothetical protein
MDATETARMQLQALGEGLQGIRAGLREITESLPGPPEGEILEEEEEWDVATELRSIIECVLRDSIEPAIRDLQAAASYRPKGEPSPG